LEGGVAASATATGMAAITAVMFFLRPGDHVITGDDIYGGTYRLFNQALRAMGMDFSFVPMRDVSAVQKAIRTQTRMIWIETPSNPLLNITDIARITELAKGKNILTVADNTFLSPYLQNPLELGVDMVVHSTTKYLNGHSDVVGGAVVYGRKELAEKGKAIVNALGLSQSPFDSWLVLRGIKTLGQRMEAHEANARRIAEFLDQHPSVKKVYYPGLKTHPCQDVIQKQMKGSGGMLAFELDRSKVDLDRFFSKLQYFLLAESLGGVESLIEHPWSMSHASMGEEGLKSSGITPETIRVSVGLEDAEDLIADLGQALDHQN